jgi:hypothetical protein
MKDIWQANAGFQYRGFSFDAVAGHANDEVSVSALAGPANLGSPFLGARVYNTDMYSFFGKYTFDLGPSSLKDDNGPGSSITISGGFEHIDFSNPTDGGFGPGHTTIGGYQLGPVYSTNGSIASGIVNYAYTGGDRIMDISFAAIKYQYDPKWAFSAGYYRYDQNSFGFGVNKLPGIVSAYSNTKCSDAKHPNCTGIQETASFRIDYQWNKNFMIYAGAAYSDIGGGLAFGYLTKNDFDPTIGVRFTF